MLPEPIEPQVISKQKPKERVICSPKSGQLIKQRRSATQPVKSVEDLEIPEYLSTKVFKSVDSYNKLLTDRYKTKQQEALVRQRQKTAKVEQSKRSRAPILASNEPEEPEPPRDFVTAINISKKTAWS